MKYHELKCRYWWRLHVLLQTKGRCAFCGSTGCVEFPIEAHHIILRSQEYRRHIRYDPQYGIPLCNSGDKTACKDGHRYAHDDNKAFMQRLEEKLIKENSGRWAAIEKVRNTPYKKPLIKEGYASIWKRLKKQFKEITKDDWMDFDY